MRNTSSASDSRRTRSGKDASVYNENGVMVAYIETFKSTVNFASSKYKVLGDMQEHATPGSYTVTLSFSAITIMSEEFFTDVMAAMEIGESPRWNIQGALGGRDGDEERVMYRDVLPDGDIWLNIDVTISSFHTTGYGAFGNLKYDISFAQKKPLEIYTTDELNTDSYVKKTNPRTDLAATSTGSGQSYTVSSGDSLWKIAQKQYGDGSKWKKIYDANKDAIEAAAKKHGKKSSDSGKWIYPGASLIIP